MRSWRERLTAWVYTIQGRCCPHHCHSFSAVIPVSQRGCYKQDIVVTGNITIPQQEPNSYEHGQKKNPPKAKFLPGITVKTNMFCQFISTTKFCCLVHLLQKYWQKDLVVSSIGVRWYFPQDMLSTSLSRHLSLGKLWKDDPSLKERT